MAVVRWWDHTNLKMFALAQLVLVVFAALLVEATPQYCTGETFGAKVGREVQLPNSYIKAGERDAGVFITSVCTPAEIHQGTSILVCDFDVSPEVHLADLISASVHRVGNAAEVASVQMWNYCL